MSSNDLRIALMTFFLPYFNRLNSIIVLDSSHASENGIHVDNMKLNTAKGDAVPQTVWHRMWVIIKLQRSLGWTFNELSEAFQIVQSDLAPQIFTPEMPETVALKKLATSTGVLIQSILNL